MTVNEDASSTRRIKLRYSGVCRKCGTRLEMGASAMHDRSTKTIACVACPPASATEGPSDTQLERSDEARSSASVAGASARREHERRIASREQRVRAQHPKLGGLLLALSGEPQSTRAWSVGAAGEERLGRRLDSLSGPRLRVLHDRQVPGTRANLDHIVTCASGVYIIDAKRYKGRPELRREGGLLSRERSEKLFVGNRDRTRLVDGVLKQVDVVRRALAGHDTNVRGVLCFVAADWTLIGGDFTTRDVYVTWPKKIALKLRQAGPLLDAHIAELHEHLADLFPPA